MVESRSTHAVESEIHVPGYEIRDVIASGGMGQVRRARDTVLDRDVAVKVLLPECRHSPEVVARFATEARITGRLQHPGIPPVHALGQLPDGSPFLAMKLIQGRTLAELLTSRSERPPEPHENAEIGSHNLIAIFEQICQAVAYAHRRGVIHRDLKPHNVMVGEFGEVQVMDWGLAKELRSSDFGQRIVEPRSLPSTNANSDQCAVDASHNTLIYTPLSEPPLERTALHTPTAETTQPGQVFGTIPYMPPEQALGQTDLIDSRSDVFSLGAILCVILTGKPPYHGTSRVVLARLAQACDLTDAFSRLDVCNADPDLITICKRCLAKERDDRPHDGSAVAQLIADYRTSVERRLREAEADQAATAARLLGERKRRRLRLLAAALAGVLVMGGVSFAWWDDRQYSLRELERRAEAARLSESESQRALADAAQLHKTQQARISCTTNLQQGFAHLHQYRFTAARNSLDAAAGLLAGGGLDELEPVVRQARSDLDLAARLDEIRFRKWVWINRPGEKGTYDRESAAPQYLNAFAACGLDIDTLEPETLAVHISASNIRDELVDALDDWAVYEHDDARKARIFAVLHIADADPWRNRFRDVATRRDRDALRQLAADANLARQRPAVVTALAEEMDSKGLESFQLLRDARLVSPTDFQLLFAMGMWHHDRDPERAIGFYRAARAVRPDNAAVNMNLGSVLGKSGRADDRAEAIACFHEVIRLEPHSASPHYNLGVLCAELNDNATARAHFERAIQLDPLFSSAHHNLGVMLERLGDVTGAERAYRESIRLAPRNASSHAMLAQLLWKSGNKSTALREYRLAADLDPNDADYPYNIGHALHEDGHVDAAIVEYKKALAINPKHAKAHNNLGIAYRDLGNRTAAIAAFRSAIASDPASAAAHYNLGVMLQDEMPPTEAIACFRTAITLEPGYARAHAHLGGCLMNSGKINEGLAELRLGARLTDTDAEPHFMYALPLLVVGDYGEANYHLHKAARLAPKDAKIRKTLGWGLRMSRDWNRAAEEYRAVVDLAPDDAEGVYFLGVSLMHLGRYAEALPHLTRGHKLGNQDQGWTQPSAGMIQRCRGCLRVEPDIDNLLIGDLEPDDPLDYILAAEVCRLTKARPDDAVILYRKAFQSEPTLATRLGSEHRLNAARAAVQAAAAPDCSALDRVRYRKWALAWLKAELASWKDALQKKQDLLYTVRQTMTVMLYDPALTSVRSLAYIALLPPAELENWTAFWREVRELRADSYPFAEPEPM